MKRIDIIYLSFLADEQHLNKYNNLSVAGSNYQLGMLVALNKRKDINLSVVNIKPIPVYPKGKIFNLINSAVFQRVKVEEVKFVNFPGIKWLSIEYSLNRIINRLIKNKNRIHIISFNFNSVFGKVINKYNHSNNINYVPIIADLPIIHLSDKKSLKHYKSKLSNHFLKKRLKNIHKAILLNPNAKKFIAENANFVVIEGGFSKSDKIEFNPKKHTKKTFLYSGTLDTYSGVEKLIYAFIDLSKEYDDLFLEIYGFGELENWVKEISIQYENINFFGVLSKSELFNLQIKAFCLVNPKSMGHPISEVTFPSKIHEYMKSGSPILSTILPGIEVDYFDCFWLIEGNEVVDYFNGLAKFIETYESLWKSKKIKTLNLITKKLWLDQIDKMIKFIHD